MNPRLHPQPRSQPRPHSQPHPRRGLALASVALCALGLWCTGCAPLPEKVVVDFAEPRLQPTPTSAPVAARAPTGSLFTSVGYRPAFEDSRARNLGDIVTIQIMESLSASQVTKSTVNRNSASETSLTPPLPGILATDLRNLNMKNATNNDFSGKGGTEAANTFSGSITTTVIEVLPNGHLVVSGEKQIGVNQNVDIMRFSGTVDPRMLQPNNIIGSTQVANVRVESRARGAQGEAHTVGWLSRFFLSFYPF